VKAWEENKLRGRGETMEQSATWDLVDKKELAEWTAGQGE
jgi:hypothetical protein